MGKIVVVRQNATYETLVLASDEDKPESKELFPVEDVRFLNPYGMMLAGLAACTAVILHTYAHNHSVRLSEVEVRATYERTFAEDCQDCEERGEFQEAITQEIVLQGELTPEQRKVLMRVADLCPIHKILTHGVKIVTYEGQPAPNKAT